MEGREEYLVLDSGAFISGASFFNKGPLVKYVTTLSVLDEIKDARSRQFLRSFPHELKVQSPSPEACCVVADFATKCGEYHVLSTADLEILALTYELEVRQHGQAHIKQYQMHDINKQFELQETNNGLVLPPVKPFCAKDFMDGKYKHYTPADDSWKYKTREHTSYKESSPSSTWGDGWISAASLDSKEEDIDEEGNVRLVGCITVDYAMQNIIMQMGLNLIAVNGLKLKRVRYWALGCYVCMNITHAMDKEFCSKCGGHSMTRVAVRLSPDGVPQYKWIRTKALCNHRNKIYSIPKPKGGHHQDPILREDDYQKAKKKASFNKKKTKSSNVFQEFGDFNSQPFGGPEYFSGTKAGKSKGRRRRNR